MKFNHTEYLDIKVTVASTLTSLLSPTFPRVCSDGMVPRVTKEKLMDQKGVIIWFTGRLMHF